MIRQAEIQTKAHKSGVRDQQIEKDYVLSWILQGIANNEVLSKTLVFKGGTVLKKVYFDDYRFSEDLDFTLLDNKLSNEHIFSAFSDLFDYVRNESNIPLEIIDNNEHEDSGINFYISYVGPLGGLGANKSIKIDISRAEHLEFEPVILDAICAYSDIKPHTLLCYSLEEVWVEKMRSVMQRMQARDFYDIWYLMEIHKLDPTFLLNEFKAKCLSRGVDPTDFRAKLEMRLPQYKGRWQKSMTDQIKQLPDFDQVLREVLRHLKPLDI